MILKHLNIKNFILKKKPPLKIRTRGCKKKSGRNHQGKITLRHRGGGHKKKLRKISFDYPRSINILDCLEHDPKRTAKISRFFSLTSKKYFYTLASSKLIKGFVVNNAKKNKPSFSMGSSSFLKSLPLGVLLHNIGSKSRKSKGILQRAQGSFGQLLQKKKFFCVVRLSSGEKKHFLPNTKAIIGSVLKNKRNLLMKAGCNRWKGLRPSVRGVAMNPVDHPHGGGEGKSSIGRPSLSPWAKPAYGKRQ